MKHKKGFYKIELFIWTPSGLKVETIHFDNKDSAFNIIKFNNYNNIKIYDLDGLLEHQSYKYIETYS